MIKKKITVRNLTASYAFSGDPSKTWYCEIVESNLGVAGNPIVNYVVNGFINLTCKPRHLNAVLDVIFHTDEEQPEVARLEDSINATSVLPDWLLKALVKILYFSKKLVVWGLGLVIMSIVFFVINYFYPITGFLTEYKKYNAANGVEVIDKTVKKMFNDPFYDSEGVKAIEEDLNISYKSMFTSVDEDLYIMKDVFMDEDDNAVLMTLGQADDRCSDLGGYILPLEIQHEVLRNKLNLTVSRWGDQPEWTGTARGLFSDDYVVNLKDGGLIEATYQKDGLIYGDAEDVKIAARCGVLRATFIEED